MPPQGAHLQRRLPGSLAVPVGGNPAVLDFGVLRGCNVRKIYVAEAGSGYCHFPQRAQKCRDEQNAVC